MKTKQPNAMSLRRIDRLRFLDESAAYTDGGRKAAELTDKQLADEIERRKLRRQLEGLGLP
jgi:hypothetical protein